MTPSQTFLRTHWDSDPLQLLLQQGRWPEVDMRWVAQQIEGRRQAREKWPSFFENEQFEYPPKLNREQSSSEAAARYKAGLIPEGCHLADMTGGMGVDSYFFAQRAAQVDYWERDSELAALVEKNMQGLGAENVTIHPHSSVETGQAPSQHPDGHVDGETGQAPSLHRVVYLDPARRDDKGRKVSGFEECEPNVLELLPRLREEADLVIIKASPMIDISLACRQIAGSAGSADFSLRDVHVVAVKGECKEVLFCVETRPASSQHPNGHVDGETGQAPSLHEAEIHAVDLWPDRTHHHSFTPAEEAETPYIPYSLSPISYLLEPHAALTKAGCHNLLSHWYPVEKLARNSHLYASPTLLEEWPGRVFEVLQEVSLNDKDIARAIPERKCHILSRNHPLGAEELRKRLKLKEGGDLHVVATTIGSKPTGLVCRRIR